MLLRRLLLLLVLLWASSAQAVFPVVEATNTSTSTTTTSHVISLPTGISAGELLLCGLNIDNGITALTAITWPAGWTELAQVPDPLDASILTAISLGYRVADGGEGATVTVSAPGNTEDSAHQCYLLSGFYGVPVVSAWSTHTAGVDVDTLVLDPVGGAQDTLWITFFGSAEGTDTTVSACPTNYTNLLLSQRLGGATGATVASCRRALNATSEDPGVFVTMNTTVGSRGITIAVLSQAPAAGNMATRALLRNLR